MTILSILKFPDPRLHTIAKPVTAVDERVRQIAANMSETMYEANGVGLAATQVDIHERIVVVDTSETRDQLQIFINPEIIAQSLEKKEWEEGCLSVPEVYDIVTRPDRVRVRALDLNGNVFEIDCDELLAVCLQHEIDHLNGKVFVQHLSKLKQNRLKAKIKKQERDN
ncbi:Peptide deformylase 1 [Ephemeroptericola cinctiostellae]|uniref:Peptide deformylase n=1 Tax=Ephemeroptericola cinctiostellae TaxID=2268024 RepID=A0A345D8J6_9BURK|nr:peptide deformylase [Ephemeroptericola cinctiostellae]AXF84684.1 Peptide deformylase 1 [Ephemeroptericola cinctiostellae]